ncbi:MAG: hypothetical protein MJY47_02065 [Fibrobacter sp.]|nr:hypothetical protein [Fibrobacter sp.]
MKNENSVNWKLNFFKLLGVFDFLEKSKNDIGILTLQEIVDIALKSAYDLEAEALKQQKLCELHELVLRERECQDV